LQSGDAKLSLEAGFLSLDFSMYFHQQGRGQYTWPGKDEAVRKMIRDYASLSCDCHATTVHETEDG